MHSYKGLPFDVSSITELNEAFEEKGIRIYNRKADVEYMDLSCELSYEYNSGKVTYKLEVYPTLTGRSVKGKLSRQNTSMWMNDLYTRMKAEYGEPSIPRLYYGHLNAYDEVESEERDAEGLNPTRAEESVFVIFDNVELRHGWFDNDGDTTSHLTITFRPEG